MKKSLLSHNFLQVTRMILLEFTRYAKFLGFFFWQDALSSLIRTTPMEKKEKDLKNRLLHRCNALRVDSNIFKQSMRKAIELCSYPG